MHMNIFIQIKQIGRRKDCIVRTPLELDTVPDSVCALIEGIVRQQVARHNARPAEKDFLPYLTQENIDAQKEAGKISFGVDYNGRAADADKAVACALQAYADGLFRLFVNDEEAGDADAAIDLHEGDTLTFIRLTMLSGRLW